LLVENAQNFTANNGHLKATSAPKVQSRWGYFMNLNRFSILNRLNQEQIKELSESFGFSYSEFREATTGRYFNEKICDKICKMLGYRQWYPKYWPKNMPYNGLMNKEMGKKIQKRKEKAKK
jgi:hypothetical protein